MLLTAQLPDLQSTRTYPHRLVCVTHPDTYYSCSHISPHTPQVHPSEDLIKANLLPMMCAVHAITCHISHTPHILSHVHIPRSSGVPL
jgi:hypothetical protein